MHSLIPGVVVTVVAGLADEDALQLLREPHLVLYVNTGLNRLVMIPITARHKKGRHYYLGPRLFELDQVERQLNSSRPVLAVHEFKVRPATNWTDEELNTKFKRKGQSESVALTKLNMRWALIEPLVTSTEKELLFDPEYRRALVESRASEALADPKLAALLNSDARKRKVKRGRAFDETTPGKLRRAINEIARCLNMFWAGGSVRGALIGFTDAMGGRGKARKAGAAKRGRPKAAVKEGRVDLAGLNVEAGSQHAKTIKFCYDTWVIRGTTEGMALRRMWTEFYSEAIQQPDGSTKLEWLPVEQRPTLTQFRYWGTKEDAASVAWRKHLPPTKFDKSYRAVMGSAADDVYAVGQRGDIDSTPPDLQLVRAIDRLARVGGGHRIIVVDANPRSLCHARCIPHSNAVGGTATVAIRIGGAYPPAALDMAYFHPALKRTDAIVVRATEGTVAIEGVQFQQWSRHRTPANPWRAGVDNVGTHLSLVEHWLEREIVCN